jgi:hypothetical protein
MRLKGIPLIPRIKVLFLELEHFFFDCNKLIEEDVLEDIFKVMKAIKI